MMRRSMTVSLAGLLLVAGGVVGQQPANKPADSTPPRERATRKSLLEETLVMAAKSNPDLRVALAKLAEAEAEVARMRLKVIQKVVTAHEEVQKARERVEAIEAQLAKTLSVVARGEDDPGVKDLRKQLAVVKTKLAEVEAELDYLLGKPVTRQSLGRATTASTALSYSDLAANTLALSGYQALPRYGEYLLGSSRIFPVAGPTADRLRKALDHKLSAKWANATARDVLKELKAHASGLHVQAPAKGEVWDEKVTAELNDVPFGAALQLLEDVLTGHRIVVREYGLFIVPQEKVPPGAMLLGDFWRDAVKATKPGTATTTPPTPASRN